MKAKIKIFGKLNEDKTVELTRKTFNFYHIMDIEILGKIYGIGVEEERGEITVFERKKPNVESNSSVSQEKKIL